MWIQKKTWAQKTIPSQVIPGYTKSYYVLGLYCAFIIYVLWSQSILKSKVKRSCMAVNGTPPQSYGMSLAIWDHTCHPTQVNAPCLNPSQTG